MTYVNLRAEMARQGVTVKQLAKLLGVSLKTASNRLSGKTEFTLGEALAINNDLFPECELAYLFYRQAAAMPDKASDQSA